LLFRYQAIDACAEGMKRRKNRLTESPLSMFQPMLDMSSGLQAVLFQKKHGDLWKIGLAIPSARLECMLMLRLENRLAELVLSLTP
jgi:hypothetical protein